MPNRPRRVTLSDALSSTEQHDPRSQVSAAGVEAFNTAVSTAQS
jgi:hypothetical protein